MEVMIDLSKQYAPKNVLSESSTSAEIKKAYKKIALKLHPDKVPKEEQQRAQAEFQILNNAFENLKESDRVKAGAKGKKKKKQTKKQTKKKGGGLQSKKKRRKRKIN
jgi:curved DNA-binding protein CbpA